jgi:hypothetical protein
MFTVLKVRDNQPRNSYKDPGWYRHPKGTVAHEWTGQAPAVIRADGKVQAPVADPQAGKARKPGANHKHH